MTSRFIPGLAAVLVFVSSAPAQTTLFQDNFDTNTAANWQVNSAAASANNFATFAYDYSALGIPAAPGGTSTLGLRLRANVNADSASTGGVTQTNTGISVSPIGLSLSGDYTLRFHAWQNAPGPFPAGGAGSTQLTGAGIGARTTTAQFPNTGTGATGTAVDGVWVGATGEGGATFDYRVYKAGTTMLPASSGMYAAGNLDANLNASDPYYNTFGNIAPPANQTTLFPSQTGNIGLGAPGFQWRQWEITKTGNTVTWDIDGKRIATLDVSGDTFQGTNIFLAQADINATTSTYALRDLLTGIIDNVVVFTPIPEPTSILAVTAAGIAGAGFLRRRFGRKDG